MSTIIRFKEQTSADVAREQDIARGIGLTAGIGFVIIAGAVLAIGSDEHFPAWLAALLVLGGLSLLVLAGSGRERQSARLGDD